MTAMNPLLEKLEPYPFERMQALKSGLRGNPRYPHVSLSIGEPKHPPPPFIVEALADREALAEDLSTYPATRGSEELRGAIAGWLRRRFGVRLDPGTQILPVAGTREALFSIGQAVFGGKPGGIGILPNPFYQIYEGAVLLGGAMPYFVDAGAGSGFVPDYRRVPDAVWARCELLYLCSPGNPTGRCVDAETLLWLLEKADRYDFIVVADECYSEIYPDEDRPPRGLLEVAAGSGRDGFERCLVFHSLSKRSNLPGLRSGFVAGDARILARYYAYRTYEGCALGAHVQRASALAWADEAHVVENRALYRAKFEVLTPLLARAFRFPVPEGGFYHWLAVGEDDEAFTRDLFQDQHITVLPGSYLGRSAQGVNPGKGRVRVAWVAPLHDCVDAARRLLEWALARR